jgi:hypothetical protein
MWAYPKHPCTQSFRSHGLAVGHIQRYPRIQGKEMNIHIDEGAQIIMNRENIHRNRMT